MRTVLVVDDNPAVTQALQLLFRLHDIQTVTAAAPQQALEKLAATTIDLVVADMNFTADTTSGDEGAQLFRAIREQHPDMPVILLTAWTHLESAVQLVKAGAADYVAKPWDDTKLLAIVENLLELSEVSRHSERLRQERRRRHKALSEQFELRGMVFASDAMEQVVSMACRVARSDVPVLITGPNGAGKERIADIIHVNSAVRSGPFIAMNCGAVPPELIEAELFGAEAGAFTSANKAREGRFELADGGTLFLDEIGNLPLAGQVKLLRVIETGQYERLGSSRTRSARVRMLSATNADLPAMIRAGRFREDLFYRLNVIQVQIPSLAERIDDILPLATHFAGSAPLSPDARAALLAHPWPGNVRELRNAIERARLMMRGPAIEAADLNLPVSAARAARDLDDIDRATIESTLQAAGGNVSRAAQLLGLSRQALYRRIERYALRP